MCVRFFTAYIGVATLAAVAPWSAFGQDTTDGPLAVSHPVLAASLDRLSAGSASWRDAVDAVSGTGRRAVIITPDKGDHGFDRDRLAQALPILDDQQRINEVVVAINIELMQRMSGLPVKAAQFEDDLDRLIAHEVFGHAIPLLLAGHPGGMCADPAPGQRATDACAIKRENVIRKELRLGQRFDYGRESLALARRSQQ